MNSNKIIISCLLILFLSVIAYGQSSVADTIGAVRSVEDSVHLAHDMKAIDSVLKNWRFIHRIINYYDKAVNDEEYKFDITFGGAPFYSSDQGFGIGAVATGLYKMDTLSRKSDISILGRVSLKGFYSIKLRGNHNCWDDRLRIEYNMYFMSFPHYWWGKGFTNGENENGRTDMTRKAVKINIKPALKITDNIYGGPVFSYEWTLGKDFQSPTALINEHKRTSMLNFGAFLTYDSRDVSYNAYKGIYMSVEQDDYINFGDVPMFRTICDFRYYKQVWKNGVMALRGYGSFSYGKVPWTMVIWDNGAIPLRSYSEGRYGDDNLLSVMVELRQRVWKRLGFVVWVGAGNFYSKEDPFCWKHTLSDIGAGLRWEFKRRVNLRFDWGFGRSGNNYMIVGVKEAF